MNWFQVDKAGLARILADRPKSFVVYELVANALDSRATTIDVEIEPSITKGHVTIKVTDDDPEGFKNLAHAYTLYADSERRHDAEKRGRFNLGEKLVLAICKRAVITTVSGQLVFSEKGRTPGRAKTTKGSAIEVLIACRRDEMFDMIAAVKRVMPRPICKLTVNGEIVPYRQAFQFFETTLPTILADDEGNLRGTRRKTLVEVQRPLEGETAMLYELGIPVVETGDEFHVNVGQKVPLNMDRDNVTPAYLRQVRVAVLNAVHDRVEDVTQAWVREACASDDASIDAVRTVLGQRFGEDAVAFDPSDLEANKRSAAAGLTVVCGGSLAGGEWQSARRAGMLLPAGKVTPSAKPYSPDGKDMNIIPLCDCSAEVQHGARYARRIAIALLGRDINVTICREADWPYAATYGPGQLTFNLSACGKAMFFEQDRMNDLLLHEFGHEYTGDHLSEEYYDSLTRLGAKLVRVALDDPSELEWNPSPKSSSLLASK